MQRRLRKSYWRRKVPALMSPSVGLHQRAGLGNKCPMLHIRPLSFLKAYEPPRALFISSVSHLLYLHYIYRNTSLGLKQFIIKNSTVKALDIQHCSTWAYVEPEYG